MVAPLKHVERWTMNLIDSEAQVWELYQDYDHYYLSIAVHFSSVDSCWDLVLDQEEMQSYEHRGRASIIKLVESLLEAAHKGDYSAMESRLAKPYERQAMQKAFKRWQEMQEMV